MTNVDDLQAAAAEQAARERILPTLTPREREIVEGVLHDHPSATVEQTLAMLRAAGM
jgi:FixJ family two-component response regulator